ncbi:MAG: hypothetical protein R3253_04825, partial [Longimicrobiales bacterium]|nr:hypothetical protein [Longimicrobiales bacterium]
MTSSLVRLPQAQHRSAAHASGGTVVVRLCTVAFPVAARRRVGAAARRAILLGLALVLGGCNYSFRAGSFPPPHIRTVSIQPFDNETARFELSAELYDQLLRSLPAALGIRTAGE